MKKTIKEIEGKNWEDEIPTINDSYLFRKAYEIYHKKINSFTTEDLRFLIGQNHYLEIAIPLAIIALKKNIFEEANSYPGSLLENVLKSSKSYWKKNIDTKRIVEELYLENKPLLEKLEVTGEIKWDIEEAYKEF